MLDATLKIVSFAKRSIVDFSESKRCTLFYSKLIFELFNDWFTSLDCKLVKVSIRCLYVVTNMSQILSFFGFSSYLIYEISSIALL